MRLEEINLRRSTTTTTAFRPNSSSSTSKIIPSPQHSRSSSSSSAFVSSRSSSINNRSTTTSISSSDKPLVPLRRHADNHSSSSSSSTTTPRPFTRLSKTKSNLSSLLRSLLSILTLPSLSSMLPTASASCRWLSLPNNLSPSLGRKVTGTLFGHRRGHVTFAVQDDPRSDPVLLIELATSTSALVKEMSSGLVRIALECEKKAAGSGGAARGNGRYCSATKLFQEPVWTMYCNGRKCGYAMSRSCTEFDWYVLSTVQSVSVGAGVIPLVEGDRKGGGCGSPEGELLYMRAKFERVVGSRDSEAFYMMNPDGNGGPELSIFLLRI